MYKIFILSDWLDGVAQKFKDSGVGSVNRRLFVGPRKTAGNIEFGLITIEQINKFDEKWNTMDADVASNGVTWKIEFGDDKLLQRHTAKSISACVSVRLNDCGAWHDADKVCHSLERGSLEWVTRVAQESEESRS